MAPIYPSAKEKKDSKLYYYNFENYSFFV